MSNSALVAVADAASRKQSVHIGLSAGGVTVYGVPVTKEEFFESVTHAVAGQAFKAKAVRRPDRDSVWATTYQEYADYYGSIRPQFPEAAEGLFFVEPLVVHPTGASGSPPGLYVPFDRIDLWWYGDPKWKAPSGGGGGWLVGGIFPVGE